MTSVVLLSPAFCLYLITLGGQRGFVNPSLKLTRIVDAGVSGTALTYIWKIAAVMAIDQVVDRVPRPKFT